MYFDCAKIGYTSITVVNPHCGVGNTYLVLVMLILCI